MNESSASGTRYESRLVALVCYTTKLEKALPSSGSGASSAELFSFSFFKHF